MDGLFGKISGAVEQQLGNNNNNNNNNQPDQQGQQGQGFGGGQQQGQGYGGGQQQGQGYGDGQQQGQPQGQDGSGKGDYIDQGVEAVGDKFGYHLNRQQDEQASDFLRQGFKSVTGRDAPIKDQN